MSTSVASVTNHFPSAENGFSTSTSASVSSGATTVQLNSVAGYDNGEVVVFVIDPTDTTKKQTFTGVVDTAGTQITNVVWTAGSNTTHALGATVVDYATATHISMISKGLRVEHKQSGAHSDITADSLVTPSATITTLGSTTANLTTANTTTLNNGGLPVKPTLFTSTTADFTGTNVNTAQPVFNTTEDTITLAANTTYIMEASYHIHTTGTTSHTLGILFGGTATLTSIGYQALSTNAATEVLGAVSAIWSSAATVVNVSAALASASHHSVIIKGIVRSNASGTFIPQYQWSAAPGVAGVTLRNSWFKLTPIGADTLAQIGGWA